MRALSRRRWLQAGASALAFALADPRVSPGQTPALPPITVFKNPT
jgi:hypothetical protein